jgi:hypothetical protein
MKHSYFFPWTPLWALFLTSKGIKFTTSDADIIALDLESWNDEDFVNLVLEFSRFDPIQF